MRLPSRSSKHVTYPTESNLELADIKCFYSHRLYIAKLIIECFLLVMEKTTIYSDIAVLIFCRPCKLCAGEEMLRKSRDRSTSK